MPTSATLPLMTADLNELLAEPVLAAQLPDEEASALVVSLAGLLAALGARLAMREQTPSQGPTRLLSVAETAERMGVSKDWLYKNGEDLPFSRKVGRRRLFDEGGMERWMKRQTS